MGTRVLQDEPHRRLELFAGAYGLTGTDGLVDEVIRQQEEVLERARRSAADGREPQLTWPRTGALDAVTDRITWSRANRHLIEAGPGRGPGGPGPDAPDRR